MKSLRAASRLSMLVAVAALTAGCTPGASTSPEPYDGIPYTIVATDGPQMDGQVFAATSMSELPPPNPDEPCPGAGQCTYPTVTPPAASLLVLFDPVQLSCQSVTGYAVSLLPGTLQIDVSGSATCNSPMGVAWALAPSALLAIPLTALPSSGTLTIVVNSFGGIYRGWPQATTTITLGSTTGTQAP
jgi:hypothetical protein